jgi:hypothetical protein
VNYIEWESDRRAANQPAPAQPRQPAPAPPRVPATTLPIPGQGGGASGGGGAAPGGGGDTYQIKWPEER